MALIELDGVWKSYDGFSYVLRGVNLVLGEGSKLKEFVRRIRPLIPTEFMRTGVARDHISRVVRL